MGRTWTEAQQKAIDTRGKTLLVSAAAGSGKTSTLTERIIRSITDNNVRADLSRMLIVTFTRASAADMKKKISEALSEAIAKHPESEHLASQMMLLESAKICTIDSFYYDLVRSNFATLSLPVNLRIADSSEIALLYRGEMESLIDDFYQKDPDFADFMEHFSTIGNMGIAVETFLSVYEDLLSYKDGIDLLQIFEAKLRDAAEKDFLETIYGKTAKEESLAALDYAISILENALLHFGSADNPNLITNYSPAFQLDLETAIAAKRAILANSYEEARLCLGAYKPQSLKATKNLDDLTVRYKTLRDSVKKLLPSIGKKYFFFAPSDISLLMQRTADVIHMLHRFLDAFDRKVLAEKMSSNICDFADIRRFALRLTVKEDGTPTELATSYRERFDEIYIDEYQDVDEVQDLIFRAIARENNRFMVGDIKQSIYGFRGANPAVFAGYKRSFPALESSESNDTASIFMSNNFRCDKNIVDFSNLIFSYLFSNCGDNIGYQREDDLIFSKFAESDDCPKVVMALTAVEEEDEAVEGPHLRAPYDEAAWIASEIKRLVIEEQKDNGSPIEYGDITVLMRAKTDLPIVKEVFDRFGIPCQNEEESDFFENPDVLLMLSLLSTIDNPRRDISLAGALRSPFFDFSMDELIAIRRAGQEANSLYDDLLLTAEGNSPLAEKCNRFLETLRYWRHKATTLPTSKLLKKLYREMSVMSLSGGRSENLLRLYEYARGYESGVFKGLSGFVSYVNELIERGTRLDKRESGSTANAVAIMSIHHSKGLEYPVCFLYGMGKKFNNAAKENLRFDDKLGIGLKLHDESGFGFIDTPVRRAIMDRRTALEREEEMRVLYVAFTRARERLYLTAAVKDPTALRARAENLATYGSAYSILAAGSFLDWIMAALHGKNTADILQIIEIPKIHTLPQLTVSQETTASTDAAEDEILTALLRERFAFVYPYAHISALPAKLSVSRLYPEVLDETEELVISKDNLLLPESLMDTKRASAAERGTATHTVLQFCDFDLAAKHGIRAEIGRLCEHRFIDPSMANIVNIPQLERFFTSTLFARIQKAKRVWREQRFNILLPASDFTAEPKKKALLDGETIAVQGVIDLFFEEENGDIILVDYKTDHLTEEELQDPAKAATKLRERHGEQIEYYTTAISLMCGKAPRERLIYSLPLADTLPL